MINLLKFRDITQPEADISSISGRICYFNHYAAGVSPIADRLGTGYSLSHRNEVHSCFFATVNEDWDYLLIVQYPPDVSFIEMITDPEYQELLVPIQRSYE